MSSYEFSYRLHFRAILNRKATYGPLTTITIEFAMLHMTCVLMDLWAIGGLHVHNRMVVKCDGFGD